MISWLFEHILCNSKLQTFTNFDTEWNHNFLFEISQHFWSFVNYFQRVLFKPTIYQQQSPASNCFPVEVSFELFYKQPLSAATVDLNTLTMFFN